MLSTFLLLVSIRIPSSTMNNRVKALCRHQAQLLYIQVICFGVDFSNRVSLSDCGDCLGNILDYSRGSHGEEVDEM